MRSRVAITIKKELREIMKDKKNLITVLFPVILIPVVMALFIFFFNREVDHKKLKQNDTKMIYHIGTDYELTAQEKEAVGENFCFEYYKTDEALKGAYEEGDIDAYICFKDNSYTVYLDNTKEYTSRIKYGIARYFKCYNNYLAKEYLKSIGADLGKVYKNFDVKYEKLYNISEEQQREEELQKSAKDIANSIFTGITYLLQSTVIAVAINCAVESIAGEKEHGTLETILTFPIAIKEFIMGKYWAMTIVSFLSSFAGILIAGISFKVANMMIKLPLDIFDFGITKIVLLTMLMLTYSLFMSGLCIILTSFAKTYKEAQSKTVFVVFLAIIPFYFESLGFNLNPRLISIIPSINHYYFSKIIFSQSLVFNDIINFGLMFVSTIVYSVVLIRMISNVYKSEKRLF